MQKLVTIYLDSKVYLDKAIEMKKAKEPSPGNWHGYVDEHLQPYLDEGWVIKSFSGVAPGHGGGGWLAVLLEKE